MKFTQKFQEISLGNSSTIFKIFEKRANIRILTFGGAFSNHIAATAAAGNILGFKTLGIIRGLELAKKIENNPTLKYANENGMKLEFISRDDFRKKIKVDL